MFIAKPHEKGEPMTVDANGVSEGLTQLATAQSAKLIPSVDAGKYTNPDGAGAPVGSVPTFTQKPR